MLYRFFAVLLAAALVFCGCNKIDEEPPVSFAETEETERPYPVSVGSFIFNEQPQTVGSLSPAVTEMICELGYSDKIIGRSNYCDYPESILSKASLGSAANPNAEAVIAAAPQLLISQSPIAKKDIISIEDAGTRVMIISAPNSVEELYVCYNDLAAVFGGGLSCAEAADAAMKPLSDALRKAENSIGSFVYIMSPELAAASDSTFAGSFFSHFGSNAAGKEENILLTSEELDQLDPEWLILPELVADDPPDEVSSLTAFKEGRVIVLDAAALERIERPTSRLSGTVYDILDQIEEITSGNENSNENDEDDGE